MRSMRLSLRSLSRVAACVSALGAGGAMGRYTDIARHDLNLGPSVARAAAPMAPPVHAVRQTQKRGAEPAAALVAVLGGDSDEEDEPRAGQPAPAHDALAS